MASFVLKETLYVAKYSLSKEIVKDPKIFIFMKRRNMASML